MADKELKIIISAVDEASKTLDKISGSTADLAKTMVKTGAMMVAVGAAITGVGVAVVKEAGKFEQYGIAFDTMLGSVEKSKSLMGDLVQFAKATPFRLEEVVQGSKQLLAYGFSQEKVIGTMKTLGNVSAALGLNLQDLTWLYGTTKTQGRLFAKDLYQFTARGIPLVAELAKQFKVTDQEVMQLVTDGKVGFKEVEIALNNLGGEGGRWGELMDKQSQTVAGKFSNMQDAIQQTAVAMGNALLPAVNSLLTALIPLIEKFGEFVTNHPQLTSAIFIIGGALLILGTTLVILAGIITAITTAFTVLAPLFTLLTGPIGLVALAIGALILVGLFLIENWGIIQQNAIMIWDMIKNAVITNAQWAYDQASAIFNSLKNNLAMIWNAIKIDTSAKNNEINLNSTNIWTILRNNLKMIADGISKNTISTWETLKANVIMIWEGMKTAVTNAINAVKANVEMAVNAVKGVLNSLASAIDNVIGKFREMVNAAKEAIGMGGKASGGGGSYQHGGVLPGGSTTTIPALLHGGERVISRTGTDVNPSGSGGGISVNLIVEGDVNSTDTIDKIIEAVKMALGRDNELAQQGVGV